MTGVFEVGLNWWCAAEGCRWAGLGRMGCVPILRLVLGKAQGGV